MLETKEQEKEKHKKNDVEVRTLIVKKYKDLSYWLPAQSDDDVDCLYFIWEEDVVWWCWRDSCWTIFGQCGDPEIEEDKISVTLLHDTVLAEGVGVKDLSLTLQSIRFMIQI